MRRFVRSLIVLILFSCPALCFGQGKLYTKGARLADFTSHTLKVVMCGDATLDAVMKDEIHSRWRLSPYEFCTYAEYKVLRTNPSYYFLMPQTGDGLVFLSLSKGGGAPSSQSLDVAFDVIKVPVGQERFSSGREYTYFPAFIDIIQNFVEDSVVSGRRWVTDLSSYNQKLLGGNRKRIYVAKEDICARSSVPEGKVVPVGADDVDAMFVSACDTALVGFAVAPCAPLLGAYSYQYVVDPSTHTLVYWSRHKFDTADGRGFAPRDLRIISLVTTVPR